MKKLLCSRSFFVSALLLSIVSSVFCSCRRESPSVVASIMSAYVSDTSYVQDKRTLIVGVTDYEPMDYKEDGVWRGFDADLATLFAAHLGVQVQFKEIEWEKKTELLESGEIDCIWNGMSRTDSLLSTISCSRPYLVNSQVIVLPEDKVPLYKHESECTHLLFAVENCSTGMSLLSLLGMRFTGYQSQKEAVQAVRLGRADAAVVDSIMADVLSNDVNKPLGYAIRLNYEQFCVGFRKSSDLTGALDTFLRDCEVDGTIGLLKRAYGIK